jgi:hypothetical protein
MASPLTVKDSFPHKDFTAVTQVGLKASSLALAHKAEIEPRLPAGALAGLDQDLESLGVVVPGAKQARDESMGATAAQNTALEKGYARIRAIRTTVRKTGAAADVKRAYGVGQKIDRRSVRDVNAALQQIVDRAKSNPGEAKGFGLIAADVTALEAALVAVSQADSIQEKRRAGAPLSTKERNKTANRILQAATRIAGAGLIAFAHQPAEQASFEALMESTERRNARAKSGGAPEPAPPA